MHARWAEDARGEGVGDASRLAAGADELVVAMRKPNWVAEEPEAHLMPHVEAACAETGSPFALEASRVERDGSLLVDVRWKGTGRDRRGARAAAYELIGRVAESASYVREGREADVVLYEVVTGMLEPDTPFAPHGHVFRLRIAGVL